jgi:DNA-binding protein HU-beta
MTANELVEHLAAAHGLTRADAKKYVDTVFTAIGDAAAKGDEIALAGFGKFAVKRTAARDGRNPTTGEPITIKAANRIGFRPAKALKDRLNGRG